MNCYRSIEEGELTIIAYKNYQAKRIYPDLYAEHKKIRETLDKVNLIYSDLGLICMPNVSTYHSTNNIVISSTEMTFHSLVSVNYQKIIEKLQGETDEMERELTLKCSQINAMIDLSSDNIETPIPNISAMNCTETQLENKALKDQIDNLEKNLENTMPFKNLEKRYKRRLTKYEHEHPFSVDKDLISKN